MPKSKKNSSKKKDSKNWWSDPSRPLVEYDYPVSPEFGHMGRRFHEARWPLEKQAAYNIHDCVGCGADTWYTGEHYMVKDSVWKHASANKPTNILCVECAEKNLGRQFLYSDFTSVPINDPSDYPKSERLQQRMKRREN